MATTGCRRQEVTARLFLGAVRIKAEEHRRQILNLPEDTDRNQFQSCWVEGSVLRAFVR